MCPARANDRCHSPPTAPPRGGLASGRGFLMSASWWQSYLGKRGRRRPRRRPRGYRPRLEVLEDRTLPSVLIPDTFLDNNDGLVGPGQFSLREAVLLANDNRQDDTIQLAVGNYNLSIAGANEDAGATGDLDLTESGRTLSIVGAGAALTAINANGLDRVLQVFPGVTVQLRNLSLTGGDVLGDGGGLLNAGKVTLIDCDVSGNTARSG